jgi:heme exporter protein A
LFEGLGAVLPQGGALVLTGPNGSGKSSLLRLLAGFGRPAAGRIAWENADIAADLDSHRARLHYIGHQDAIKPALAVAETLGFWCQVAGRRADSALEALDRFGLAALAGLPCRFLSAGQRRRLALSRLIAWKAPLWLLDEPSVGLDRESLAMLASVCRQHREAGGSIVVSTHQDLDLDGAETISLADFPPRPVELTGW